MGTGHIYKDLRRVHGQAVRALDFKYKGHPKFKSAASQHFAPLSKELLLLIAPLFEKSCKAVGPVYWNRKYLMHVKEHHRLFKKNRGSSQSDDCTSKYTHLL